MAPESHLRRRKTEGGTAESAAPDQPVSLSGSSEEETSIRTPRLKGTSVKPPSPDVVPLLFTPWAPFLLLLSTRCLSTWFNTIHDCDETFNYWEPLHFLVHGYGFQTWEYSADNALRSYLYLLIHAAFVAPASFIFGNARFKFLAFYSLRFALAVLSSWTDSRLVLAVCQSVKSGGQWFVPIHTKDDTEAQRMGLYTLLLLCFCTGPFLASTTFLPSSFSMLSTTLATALLLLGRPLPSVAVAAVGVLLGWPFAVLAAAPLVLAAFLAAGFFPVLITGLTASVLTFAASTAVDWFFYGRLQCSILNLVWYNVFGGSEGGSALYGVEGPLFYFKNGLLNFNLALPLAFSLPFLWALAPKHNRRPYTPLLAAALAPFLLWFAFMSLQAHKEERFLYVVYPLICVSAAAGLSLLPHVLSRTLTAIQGSPSMASQIVRLLQVLALAVIVAVSCCRTTAVLSYYRAPVEIYRHIPPETAPCAHDPCIVNVCVGSEWHRFMSSFFLPSPHYRLRFLDDGFRGLLPFPFNSSLGGTASAPPYFNRANKAAEGQFLEDESACSFLIELDTTLSPPDTTLQETTSGSLRSDNASKWQVVTVLPYLDATRTPMLHRVFYIPGMSSKHLVFGKYKLSKRQSTLS